MDSETLEFTRGLAQNKMMSRISSMTAAGHNSLEMNNVSYEYSHVVIKILAVSKVHILIVS